MNRVSSRLACAVLCVPLCAAMPALANKATPSRTPVAAPSPHNDGAAEARLIEIYRLIGDSRTREALDKAQRLVQDYPHFQLAQLVYGDLLASRARPVGKFGDVPADMARLGGKTLADLRVESMMRLKALRERPPADSVPSQFVALSLRHRHAIAVDASRSRLYLFSNGPQGLKIIADYYISVGKAGIEKSVEGDQRTPLGVYFIISNLDPKSLKDFYGSGALPINYPNELDARRGKSGSGIWLHGTPPNQFARAPLATDGCVVLANPDLTRIIRTVEVRSTPVVIASKLDWVPHHSVRAQGKPFEDALRAWSAAKVQGNLDQLMSFYTPDFTSRGGKSLRDWTPVLLSEVEKVRGRALQIKDLSYLRWTDSEDTMVVTFGEVLEGARTGTTKRQYWIREGTKWKIFHESNIG